MIRVLLVDDQPLLRSGFRALLDLEDDIEVVAEGSDGQEGLALAREHLPDIALVDPSITRELIDRYVAHPPGPGLEGLTDREREAVVLVARGLSNDEIAGHMVINPLTAKTHVNRAMAKLHARDRAQLVILAYESGLVTPRGR